MNLRSLHLWLRLFERNRLHTLLNVAGLGLGLAVCVLIALFVYHELDHDRGFANADRIVRVAQVMQNQTVNRNAMLGLSSPKLAPLLREGFDGVEAVARYTLFANAARLQAGNVSLQETGLRYAEQDFTRIFGFRWLAGTPATALAAPDSLVLTAPLAIKLFGTADALGRTVKVDSNRELTVTGVIDTPVATHLNFTALAPIALFDQQLTRTGMGAANWGILFSATYALLTPTADRADVQRQLDQLAQRESASLPTPPGGKAPAFGLQLEPLRGIYLSQTFQGGSAALSNWQRVLLSGGIGLCVLLIAVVNFMNLATAGATRRALEVGVKVALGASRAQLVRQFLGESLLLVVLALLLAMGLAELVLPVVNARLGLTLDFAAVPVVVLGMTLLAAALLLGLLAGAYPAFYLTAWQPARVLRGLLHRGRGGAWFRNVLVVVQFSVSIALIVAALVMQSQLRFAAGFDHGFRPERVHILPLPNNFAGPTQADALIERLRAVPGVEDTTRSLSSPLLEARFGTRARTTDSSLGDKDLTMGLVADNYLQFYGIRLLTGRTLGGEGFSDRIHTVPREGNQQPNGGIVLNEAAVRQFGWTPAEALGKTLQMPAPPNDMIFSTVVGVVADTVASTRDAPLPMAYMQVENMAANFFGSVVGIKLAAGAGDTTLAQIRQVAGALFASEVVQTWSLADRMAGQYGTDRLQMQIFAGAAVLAVAIACFGLFGLATFNTERRTKEIGVRKVMGSSVWEIVLLLTHDFSKLVLVANVIAWPLAYYGMNRWLQNFTYRIDLTPVLFIGSGLIALCIAWVTVGGTAARAASRKPVLALRYE